jgi:hypothetical protein
VVHQWKSLDSGIPPCYVSDIHGRRIQEASKMKEYKRAYPAFSLCGLRCGLCPRYYTNGSSRCPGCGGEGFHLAHPSCAVITCSKKHGDIQFCCHCADYPCERYATTSTKDSFITYQNVIRDFQRIHNDGFSQVRTELEDKMAFLEFLLKDFDDGRRKSLYCTAVSLLALSDLNIVREYILRNFNADHISLKEKAEAVSALLREAAERNGISLELRK